MTDDASPLRVSIEADGVALFVLNRPRARNALNSSLLEQLHNRLTSVAASSDVGAIVITGSGTAFCAGADLREPAQGTAGAGPVRADAMMQLHAVIPALPVPVIAAVNGPAIGGGCGLAVSCDFVYASTSATFGFPEVGIGRVPAIVAVGLIRAVGRRMATEMLLGADVIGADAALSKGLVNAVVNDDELLPTCTALATKLASRPREVVAQTKDLLRHVANMATEPALAYARSVNTLFNA